MVWVLSKSTQTAQEAIMSKYVQLEYSFNGGRTDKAGKLIRDTDFFMVSLDNILVIHLGPRQVVLPEEHRYNLTERGWGVLMDAITKQNGKLS
jgi:hypothetical protein